MPSDTHLLTLEIKGHGKNSKLVNKKLTVSQTTS